MDRALQVEVLTGAEPVQVLVSGEIDLATAGQITAALAELTGHDVIVDLSQVAFIDSSGLSSLIVAHKNITAAGGTLMLRNPSPTAATLLALTAIDTVIEVIDY